MMNTIQDLWKQALGSEIHCVAVDATAIILQALFIVPVHF